MVIFSFLHRRVGAIVLAQTRVGRSADAIGILPPIDAHDSRRRWYVCNSHFALRFPSGETGEWKRRIAALLPIFAGACLAWNFFLWFVEFYPTRFNYPDVAVDIAVRVVIALLAVVSVIATYRSSAHTVRPRLKWAIFGMVLGCATLAFRSIVADTSWLDRLDWLACAIVLGVFIAPLAVAYAILRHRVIDVRFVLNRALVYLAVTSLLGVS